MAMKFYEINPPREFEVGLEIKRKIKDCGKIKLSPDEQVAFVTESGKEYDLTRKDFGFYATPSVNIRLGKEGFKTAIVKNSQDRYFIMIVEADKMNEFQTYLDEEKQKVIEWLDERI